MFRSYTRKYDMEEPPKLEDTMDETEAVLKRDTSRDVELEERFYR